MEKPQPLCYSKESLPLCQNKKQIFTSNRGLALPAGFPTDIFLFVMYFEIQVSVKHDNI